MQAKELKRVISVNVGRPREVEYGRKTVATGIFKEPVQGRVTVRKLNIDGDQQADLTVHGGVDKAIYVYPAEYYDYWRAEFPEKTLNWGMFGENLTTEGLIDDAVHIGDRFQIGSIEAVVTQPRVPCFKLGIKFGTQEMVKRFLKRRYTGFYLAVLKEGEIAAGDAIVPLSQDEQRVTISEAVQLYSGESNDPEILRRILQVEALAPVWRSFLQERLNKLQE